MTDATARALNYVRSLARGAAVPNTSRVTFNFHPDTKTDGVPTIVSMAADGFYRSQFETGTSNGDVSAFPDGARWEWEDRMFSSAYNQADPSLRPKYGALNHRDDLMGGSRRFGSCFMRLANTTLERATFCYPDSHLEPTDFGTADACDLLALCRLNDRGLDPWLDNYVEAHVHGLIRIEDDVEAIVLDPSYRGTEIEAAARTLGCAVEWHGGYALATDRLAECAAYRGTAVADALGSLARQGVVTPRTLGEARDVLLDYQMAKWAWHCLARFGERFAH